LVKVKFYFNDNFGNVDQRWA